MMKPKVWLIVVTIALLFTGALHAQSSKKYWVYFSDKGPSVSSNGILLKSSSAYQKALEILKPRALERRAKVLPNTPLIDFTDLPVYDSYVRQIERLNAIPSQHVRFLNAASFFLTDEQQNAIAKLPFVVNVTPVVISTGKKTETNSDPSFVPAAKATGLSYGPSLNQNNMIHVLPLHEMGITGKGVLVGMLDTGFRWRVHESLNSRNVIAEYDFVQHDSVTANGTGNPVDRSDQDQHGTLTMSTLGGFMPGKLIGPAFGADFILGKTEYVPITDYQWEEDNWVAGLEWLESMGADLVSSSLGYDIFVDATTYTWANGDFDGRTTLAAQAAVRAARLGLLICDAMGNEYWGSGTEGTMITPADADSIISVGAVSFSRKVADFSSIGPTNDGRIKPDVVAPGVGIYCASTGGASSYFTQQGTSLATPLTAGVCALMLSARPELTPIQIRDALRNTADTVDVGRFPTRPNNYSGWGLIDAMNAALSFGPIFSNTPAATVVGPSSVVSINVVSKFGIKPGSVTLFYAQGASNAYDDVPMSLDSAFSFPTSGRYSAIIPAHLTGLPMNFYIEAQDSALNSYQSPAQSTGLKWQLIYGITGVHSVEELPSLFSLAQNYPNPFNPSTMIRYELPAAGHVTLKVYDVLGQEVTTLVDEFETPGVKNVEFNIGSSSGTLASGVYFYRLVTPAFSSAKKMMFLR